MPLVHQGKQLGELILSARQREEELTPADLRLVRDLAIADIRRLVYALRPPALDDLVYEPRYRSRSISTVPVALC